MSPVFFAVSLGPRLFCLETVVLEKDLVSWLFAAAPPTPPPPPRPRGLGQGAAVVALHLGYLRVL